MNVLCSSASKVFSRQEFKYKGYNSVAKKRREQKKKKKKNAPSRYGRMEETKVRGRDEVAHEKSIRIKRPRCAASIANDNVNGCTFFLDYIILDGVQKACECGWVVRCGRKGGSTLLQERHRDSVDVHT